MFIPPINWCGFSLLLLSGDLDIQSKVKHTFINASVTIAKNVAALPQNTARRTFNAVIIESTPNSLNGAASLASNVDLTDALVITGSRTVLKRASKFMHMIAGMETAGGSETSTLSLEDYLEWKMGDFVKGTKNGSGRNLHPMVISAIERPLITKALQATNGNQIQAAELLGLNRNTLRKKIKDLQIPLKQKRQVRTRTV